VVPGVEPRELICRQRRKRTASVRGSLEPGIVMDDDHAVPRKVHVQLEPVRAERKSMIERQNRVLGPQRRPAAMRIHKGHARF
jgi:hypothetical protein